MSIGNLILVITATLTGLMAGLFYGWSCSVMPGLGRLADREFVAAMRAANRAIQNPVFFAAFFGAPLFLIVSTVFFYGESPRFALLLAATVVYLAGNFGVTVFGNVPMNDLLERFAPENAADEDVARERAAFEKRWTRLNHVRAVASTAAIVLVAVACLVG